LHVRATRGIVAVTTGGGGSMIKIEKLTTSLQFLGAALAVPAGAAGVYSAYHNYFSPEVMCQEMRNSTLVTLEKNIPAEAKRALLRKEVEQFESKCSEVEPETRTIFQVALQELDKPAPAPRAAQRAAQPRPAVVSSLSAQAGMSAAAEGPVKASPPAVPPAALSAAPAAAPLVAPLAAAPASAALASPAAAAPPTAGILHRAVHGWVALEIRKAGKVTEAFFSGYTADGQSLPGRGTVLTSMAFRPIWSEPQGPGPNDPTKMQGRLKTGECVRVVDIRPSPGRQWAEVEPTSCQ
jgi:hypothetical protein